MSEHLRSKDESYNDKPELSVEKEHLPNIEKLNQKALEQSAEKANIEELSDAVTEKAKSSNEVSIEDKPVEAKQEFGAYAELKSQTYANTLKHVQKRLSKSERTMSKVMHSKTVEKVSDGVAKTAARPSGILGGGIVSFIGSFVVLYMAKKYGFEYNFVIFFLLLAGGFGLGVLIELSIYAIRKARRN